MDILGWAKDREREVMQYVAAGKANKEIANLPGLSIRTIQVHRKSVMKKKGTESLPDLVRKYAIYQGDALIPNRNSLMLQFTSHIKI